MLYTNYYRSQISPDLISFFFEIYRVIRDGYICPFNLKTWQHLYSEVYRERYRGVNSIHKRDLSSHLLSASHPRHRSFVCLDFLIVRKDSMGSYSPKISKVLSFFLLSDLSEMTLIQSHHCSICIVLRFYCTLKKFRSIQVN